MLRILILVLIEVSVIGSGNGVEFNNPLAIRNSEFFNDVADFYTLRSAAILDPQCRQHCDIYRQGLLDRELWALSMYDASSKVSSGMITSGNIGDFGDFETCINIKHESFPGSDNTSEIIRGKYCLTELKGYIKLTPFPFQAQEGNPLYDLPFLRKLNGTNVDAYLLPSKYSGGARRSIATHRWSICVPDVCSGEEIAAHLQIYFGMDEFGTGVKLDDNLIQTLDSQWGLRTKDWIILAFFAVFIILMVVSTIYDTFLHYSQGKPAHWSLVAFSCLTNGKRLVTVVEHPDMLPCLDGIRVIGMVWIILGHECESEMFNANYNSFNAFRTLYQFWYQFIFANLVFIDLFFMLGGLLLMYGFMRGREKDTSFNLIKFYARRYLRLTPSLLAAILGSITFVRIMGRGPLYQAQAADLMETCEDIWWHPLIYLSNYISPHRICVPQSWYLAVDTQLYWISPLVLLPIVWYRKAAWYYLSVWLAASIAVPFYIVYANELQSNGAPSRYLPLYHIATHCRVSGWIIGIGLGYLIYQTKKKRVQIPMWVASILWILSITSLLYCSLGNYPNTQPEYVYHRLYNSLFIVLTTVFYCLGMAWVIFACIHGYGGIVNWFLSLPFFQVLSRLCYAMFLTHYAIQYCMAAAIKTPGWFSKLNLVYGISGLMVVTTIISIIWTMAFEMPFLVVDTHIFRKAKKTVTLPMDKQPEGTYTPTTITQ